MNIGGNIYALLQVKDAGKKNAIGEKEHIWTDYLSILGWLDLSSGDSKHTNFNAKVQESTHIFLCDFIPELGSSVNVNVSENARMIIDDLVYEILLIDNPMNMNEHLEVYLRFIGGQNGS